MQNNVCGNIKYIGLKFVIIFSIEFCQSFDLKTNHNIADDTQVGVLLLQLQLFLGITGGKYQRWK
jgi:hypothetical protein